MFVLQSCAVLSPVDRTIHNFVWRRPTSLDLRAMKRSGRSAHMHTTWHTHTKPCSLDHGSRIMEGERPSPNIVCFVLFVARDGADFDSAEIGDRITEEPYM